MMDGAERTAQTLGARRPAPIKMTQYHLKQHLDRTRAATRRWRARPNNPPLCGQSPLSIAPTVTAHPSPVPPTTRARPRGRAHKQCSRQTALATRSKASTAAAATGAAARPRTAAARPARRCSGTAARRTTGRRSPWRRPRRPPAAATARPRPRRRPTTPRARGAAPRAWRGRRWCAKVRGCARRVGRRGYCRALGGTSRLGSLPPSLPVVTHLLAAHARLQRLNHVPQTTHTVPNCASELSREVSVSRLARLRVCASGGTVISSRHGRTAAAH
jgi:hypothetical protein